jgi:hypothetical protein
MADEADLADIIQTRNLEQSLHLARTVKPGIVASGSCHFCEEGVAREQLFCDQFCQEDWERQQAALRRTGGGRIEASVH